MNNSSLALLRMLDSNLSTAPVVVPILGKVLSWYILATAAATLILNGLLVLVYIKHQSLRTPFNTYIANLAIAEVLFSVISMPGNFLVANIGYWPLNLAACSILMYTTQIFGSAIRYCHVVITCNRLWAVTFPFSYRSRHTIRVANLIIMLMWVFVHAVLLPSFIRTVMWPKYVGGRLICAVNSSFQLALVLVLVELFGFGGPEVFILMSYVFIVYKFYQRRKEKCRIHAADGNRSLGQLQTLSVTDPENIHTAAAIGLKRAVVDGGNGTPQTRRTANSTSRYKVLSFLVAAVCICWTPNNIFYLMYEIVPGYWNQEFFAIQLVLIYSNSWINPLLCYLSLPEFRLAVTQVFRRHCH